VIYQRVDELFNEDNRLVKWTPLYEINNLSELLIVSRHNYLFTPDFDYYLDIDYNKSSYIIKKSETGEVYKTLSPKLFSIVQRGQKRS